MQIQLANLDAVSLLQLRSTLHRVTTLHMTAARAPGAAERAQMPSTATTVPQAPGDGEQRLAA